MIGLLDVDGKNYPNLALMKLSAYHKSKGDKTEFADMFGKYDVIYKSKVFTFTADDTTCYDATEIKQGGTGYNSYENLPDAIEHIYPDYELYSYGSALGFATRGCIRKCPWCVVPDKEGKIKPNAEIYEFWRGQKEIVLMDNNILAHDFGLEQLENCIKEGIKVDCNQGLDAHLIAKSTDIQKLLAGVKWTRFIRLACDTKSQMESVRKSVEGIRKYSGKKGSFFCYVLIQNDIQDAVDRMEFLRDLGVDAFGQPYRDFTTNGEPTREQKRLARWCNHKAIFKSVEWEDYKKKEGI